MDFLSSSFYVHWNPEYISLQFHESLEMDSFKEDLFGFLFFKELFPENSIKRVTKNYSIEFTYNLISDEFPLIPFVVLLFA